MGEWTDLLSDSRGHASLSRLLGGLTGCEHAGAALKRLVDAGWGELPHPGSGRTLERWRALSTLAQHDLAVAKLLESHIDALAILRELDMASLHAPGQTWAVWCAEPPDRRVSIAGAVEGGREIRIRGTKAWCSAAQWVSHAIVSGCTPAGEPCLAAIDLVQPGVTVTRQGRHAVGMAGTASVDVIFDGAHGVAVGRPGDYTQRPGFLHGAAGVAACWYGGAVGIAGSVHQGACRRPEDPYAQAHLGTLDVWLAQAASLLREAAAQIDAFPMDDCGQAVRRARLGVEAAAQAVLQHAPRMLGAGPLCKNATLARLTADLPVYIRQSHAERDLAAHGVEVAARSTHQLWAL